MDYKICFSLTAHENLECLQDNLEAIQFYAPNSCVIIAIGEIAGKEGLEQAKKVVKPFDFCQINPKQFAAKWGNGQLINAIVNNFNFACKQFQFEYYCLEASNALLVQSGLEEYVQNFDAGANLAQLDEKHDWKWTSYTLDDPVLKKIITAIGPDAQIYAGQHEGTFYKKSLFTQIYNALIPFCPVEDYFYPREETFIQTVLGNMQSDLKLAPATNRMWADANFIYDVCMHGMQENHLFSLKPVPRSWNAPERELIRLMRETEKSALT